MLTGYCSHTHASKFEESPGDETHMTKEEVLRRVIPYGGSISQFSVVFNAVRCKPFSVPNGAVRPS